jgi:predicted DNA-binding transcriptional regulator AlpA
MTSIELSSSHAYLDAHELADLLGLSVHTISLRAKRRPWLLPPRAELRDRDLLRWRVDAVNTWVQITGVALP